MLGFSEDQGKILYQDDSSSGMRPIEPEKGKITKLLLIKWLLFLFFFVYILISHYYPAILTFFGRYLIIDHSLENSDLIVCLAGENVERGLAAADAYKDGLAPLIFLAREGLQDGHDLLKEEGIEYPESVDLIIILLKRLGIPESAIIIGDTYVESTLDEAQLVRKVVENRRFKSLIIITSPTQSRRAWLTYKKVFRESDVRILVLVSEYSNFSPGDWWKKRKYTKQVVLEYEKLIYYTLKYFI